MGSPVNGLLPKSNYLPEHYFPRRSGSAFLTPPASGYPDSEFTQFVNSPVYNGIRQHVRFHCERMLATLSFGTLFLVKWEPKKCSMSRSGEGLIANIVSNKVLPVVMLMKK